MRRESRPLIFLAPFFFHYLAIEQTTAFRRFELPFLLFLVMVCSLNSDIFDALRVFLLEVGSNMVEAGFKWIVHHQFILSVFIVNSGTWKYRHRELAPFQD